MKIYTKVVIDLKTGNVLEEKSFEYTGPVAECISFGHQKATQRPEKVEMWTPEQKELFQALAPILRAGITRPAPTYPGQMHVPRTPEEEGYFQGVPELATFLGGARARLREPSYQITPEATEQFYQEAIRAPMMREWGEVVEPMIREAYAGPGYWGSARAEAQTRGAQDLATQLGAQRAGLYYQDELARRQALESAAAREATQAGPMATTEAGLLGTAGEYARMIDQEKVLADMQRWLTGEEVEGVTPTQYNPFMQLVFQALGLTPFALGTVGKSKGFGFGIGSSGSLGPTLKALGYGD